MTFLARVEASLGPPPTPSARAMPNGPDRAWTGSRAMAGKFSRRRESVLRGSFPFFSGSRVMSGRGSPRDAIASVSIWAVLVPQALAYSSIAGVPVQYGLYTAFAALLGYALFGTSRHMVQGPSAAVAAVVAAVITPLVGAAALGTDDAAKFAAALALATGVVYLALGIARMGWVSNFLSKAVMGGFVLGFSIGIIIDQSYKLFGVRKSKEATWRCCGARSRSCPTRA